jgi:hypothetical protein
MAQQLRAILWVHSETAKVYFVIGPWQSKSNDLNSERVIGAKGRFLSKIKVVSADKIIIDKVIQAKKVMKEIRRTSIDEGTAPQTIDEAATLLSRIINMACPPEKCIEYEGVFYFSGGTSAKPIDDFSSGLAIKKGETTIYEWSSLNK